MLLVSVSCLLFQKGVMPLFPLQIHSSEVTEQRKEIYICRDEKLLTNIIYTAAAIYRSEQRH